MKTYLLAIARNLVLKRYRDYCGEEQWESEESAREFELLVNGAELWNRNSNEVRLVEKYLVVLERNNGTIGS